MISITLKHSHLGSGLIQDSKALLFVQTVMLRTWKAISLVLDVSEGSY
jgi:hypothetical protein